VNTLSTFYKSFATALKSSLMIIVIGTLMACQSETSAQTLDETTFTKLPTPIKVSTGDKIEVTELFWYGCGHCFALEPHVNSWNKRKADNVEFVKVPAIFSSRWEFTRWKHSAC